MNINFLSGLLLTTVVLVVVGYLVKELFGHSLKNLLTHLVAEHRTRPAAGVNDHLIGAVGRVVADGKRAGEMRVRVGGEGWSARLGSADGGTLPVGAQIVVEGVAGNVLEVSEKPSA